MFDLIHEMRKRVFTSKSFTSEHIIGAILFEKTMLSKVNGEYTADYLWNEKNIVSFLKVDKGLQDEENGVKLMKEIPELSKELQEANEKHVFGTKMRSVIYEPNREGIKKIVKQQFDFAKIICDAGLVPIIEPEVDIHSEQKEMCEVILKEEIKNKKRTGEHHASRNDAETTNNIQNKKLHLPYTVAAGRASACHGALVWRTGLSDVPERHCRNSDCRENRCDGTAGIVCPL